MGNYNPDAPQILGNEWVGIRDENLTFSPAVNAVEQGHGFTLATSRQLGNARFYINEFPNGGAGGQTFMASIYARGTEDQSGPVQRVIIPCNAAAVTGSATATTTLVNDLYDPSDFNGVLLSGNTSGFLACFFAVNAYSLQLTGKRILGVNFLYSAYSLDFFDDVAQSIGLTNDALNTVSLGSLSGDSDGVVGAVRRIELGEVNPFWTTVPPSATNTERLPWNYSGLQKFEVSASGRIRIYIRTFGNPLISTSFFVTYAALEIFYCEEKRLAIGSRVFGSDTSAQAYRLGTNIIPMRDLSQAANPVLAAGQYDITLSSADTGAQAFFGVPFTSSQYPTLNALRELYAIPPHPGVLVKLPFPKIPDIVGRTFTAETTHVLPQLSLHTTGGVVLTEPHVYGRQAAAPVWSGAVATQGIINSASGSASTNYPQVRFWARRFGDTTQPLVFKTQSGVPVFSSQITVADFDALPEILDGWREVNLTFTGFTPSFNAGGTATTYEWSSSAETVGNRWEVLGVTAPALSGIPGNLLQTVPTAQVLDSATYGGATAFMAWLQPNSGATASDTTTDASVMFSQGMPDVTSLAVITASQAVSGIGMECTDVGLSIPPACIPTGISYAAISWTPYSSIYGPSSAPVTGFGYYEIQRMDTIDDWASIAQLSTVSTASFIDYEPRVGILSSYRIRGCDLYGFCGSWSSTVTNTLLSPGISGTDGNGVLIFTSNEHQDGSINLAYTQTWESNPEESFSFPEASSVKLQEFYGYDFVTAFRPLERGGERFEATLLVQAAAVSAPVLENVFHSLRDMAWDTVSQICVRNELGDRWFATIIVPDGRVKRNRRLQLARIQIIEVSDIPSVVEL